MMSFYILILIISLRNLYNCFKNSWKLNTKKLILINSFILLNGLVNIAFYCDGLQKLLKYEGYSDQIFVLLFNGCYVSTALVLAIGSYFWMSTIQLMSITTNRSRFNWAKLFIIVIMIMICVLSSGTGYFILS